LEAKEVITKAGLVPLHQDVACEPGPNGAQAPCTADQISKVIRTDPPDGTQVQKGAQVTVFVGAPPGEATVPDLKGKSPQEAQAIIDKDPGGFKLQQSAESVEVDDPKLQGKVATQNPESGLKLKKGGTINIQLGKAPDKQNVPNVVGSDENDARQTLEGSGFKVNIEQVDSTKPQGQVVSQNPTGNSKAVKDSVVTLRVSKGNQIEMPDLTGMTEKEVTDKLRSLGWNGNLNVQQQQVNNPSQDKTVIAQNPAKGQPVTKGASITITVGKFGIVTT
jgi:serine/threonine-protein kinase